MRNDQDDPSAESVGATNFAHLLWRAAHRFDQHPAMVERGHSVSFAAVGERAAGIASALVDAGVQPGDRVAVLLPRGETAAAAFFAALAAGAIGINLNEMYRPRQIEYVLTHARVRILLTSADVVQSHPRPIETTTTIIDVGTLPETGRFTPVMVDASAPAQITYTSGSTGQPKGVVMSHSNLWAGVQIVAGYLGITATDRIASLLPFSFVYGFNQLTCSLLTGATLVIERSTLSQEITAALRRERVTVLAAVPPLWLQLLRTPAFRDAPQDDLRVATNAGGRLPPASVQELRRAQPQASLFLMYGLTEVFRSSFLPPAEVDAHPDSMGRPIPQSVIYVVREDGTLCAPDEIGELVHGGPTVGIGYLDDPDGTARVFRPNPFRDMHPEAPARVVYSGDLVRRDAEGRLYYVGRRDRMFKTLGYRVSPDEIADVLYASGQVDEAVVLTEPDAQRGQRIVACVVLRDGGSLHALRKHCGIELPRYMQPARYDIRTELPRNMSGKHDMLALRRDLTTAL
ncbi:MAG TPA: AMP-binding protein [Gemmatimonadaceae bacterium]|nr:AMP-binding protein [Gemmatimonadaceae bacterium]